MRVQVQRGAVLVAVVEHLRQLDVAVLVELALARHPSPLGDVQPPPAAVALPRDVEPPSAALGDVEPPSAALGDVDPTAAFRYVEAASLRDVVPSATAAVLVSERESGELGGLGVLVLWKNTLVRCPLAWTTLFPLSQSTGRTNGVLCERNGEVLEKLLQ